MTLTPTVDEQLGQVLAVYELQSGGTLAADVPAGAITLTVVDPADFHELGGQLYLASGDDATITTEVFRYTRADLATGVLTLELPYPADWPAFVAGDYVWLSPLATERRVDVALDGEADQLVTARLPFGLASSVPIGVRPPDAGEWLRVSVSPLGYDVLDVVNEYPATDPASVQILDPDTGEVVGELGADAAFDTVTADEIYSDTVPYRNADDLTLYVDPVNGSDDNDGTAYPPLVDLFERTTVSPSWGVADTGQPWTSLRMQGGPSDVGVNVPGSARLRTTAANQSNRQQSGFGGLDVDVSSVINFASSTPASSYVGAGVAARMIDNDNFYLAELVYFSNGTFDCRIETVIAGATATVAGPLVLGTFATAPALNAIDWAVRFQVQSNPDGGTDLRLKVWDNAGVEPEAWQLVANDVTAALQQPNAAGAASRSGTGTGNFAWSYRNFTAAVIDAGGLVIDTTQGGVGALRTIAAALALVGNWNDGIVRILLTGVIDEQVNVRGISGAGTLIIDGAGVATIYGTVNVVRCPCAVELRNFTLQDTGDVAWPNKNQGSLEVGACAYVYVYGVLIQSNTSRSSNVYFYDAAHGRVDSCQLSGSTQRCIYAANASLVIAATNTGSAPTDAYRSSTSIIWAVGTTQPTGGNAAGTAGKVYTANTVEAAPPTGGGGTAPPPSTKKTTTHSADKTQTWRPEWGWKSGDDAYQGEYAGSGGLSRGCAFYGSKLIHAGKTADSGSVYIVRLNSGGASQAQNVYLATCQQGSKPSGRPDIGQGPVLVGSLAWGQGKWFAIPKAWVTRLIDGTDRGLMIYHGSASPYIICAGRSKGANRFQVKLTYH